MIGETYSKEISDPDSVWPPEGTHGSYATTRYVDVDGDGILDLVRTNARPDSFVPTFQPHWDVCYGAKDGFEPCASEETPLRFPRVGQSPVLGAAHAYVWDGFEVVTEDGQVDLFDIDQDGWLDIVEVDQATNDWVVYFKNPGRTSGWQQTGVTVLSGAPASFNATEASVDEITLDLESDDLVTPVVEASRTLRSVQDINGDGVVDLIEADPQSGDWLVYRGTGMGFDDVPVTWEAPLPYLGFAIEGAPNVTVVSVYDPSGSPSVGPGSLEELQGGLFIGQISSPEGGVLYKDKLGTMAASGSIVWGDPSFVTVGLIDMDGDGLQDLFDGPAERWYRNLGDGFDPFPNILDAAWPKGEKDGQTFAYLSRSWSWSGAGDRSNQTDWRDTAPDLADSPPSTTVQQVVVRDMNGDRLPDVVVVDDELFPEEVLSQDPLPRGIIYTGAAEPQTPPGLLKTVISGQGLRTDVGYVQSTAIFPSGATACDSVDAELARPLVASISAIDPFEESVWERHFDYGESYCDLGVCWGFYDILTTDFVNDGGDWRGSETYTAYDPFWIDGPRMDFQALAEVTGSPAYWDSEPVRWRTWVSYDVHGWPVSRELEETREGLSRSTYGTIAYDAVGNPEVVTVSGADPKDTIETHTTWISDADGVLWVPEARWTRAWHWPAGAVRTVERGRFAYDDGAVGAPPVEGHLTYQEVGAASPGPSIDSELLTWSFTWDARGNVESSTDPMGNVTTWVWDLFGGTQWSSMTNPLGWTSTQLVDAEGRVIQQVNENGETTDTTYDDLGRAVSVSTQAPGGTKFLRSTTTYTEADVDPAVLYTEWVPAFSTVAMHRYGSDGAPLVPAAVTMYEVMDAGTGQGAVVWTEHEAGGFRVNFVNDGILGQPIASGVGILTEFDPLVRATTTDNTSRYDGLGEPVYRWSRDAGDTVISYPEPGVVQEEQHASSGGDPITCTVDRVNLLRNDIHGRLVQVAEGDTVANAMVTGEYRYDGRARMTSFLDMDGNRYDYRFDGAGRLRAVWRAGNGDPVEEWVSYSYDLPFSGATGPGPWPTKMEIGNPSAPDTAEWVYDPLGRTVSKTLQQGHRGAETFTWEWDTQWKGSRDAITFPLPDPANAIDTVVGRVDYTYAQDATLGVRGLVASETRSTDGVAKWTVSYVHDGQGMVTHTAYPGGEEVDSFWHPNGRLQSQDLRVGGLPSATYNYTHNRWGTTAAWGGGQLGAPSIHAEVARGGPNRYARLAWTMAGKERSVDYGYCGDGSRLVERDYQVNAAGALTQRRFRYAYDMFERITRVQLGGTTTEDYSYELSPPGGASIPTTNITFMDVSGAVAGAFYSQGWVYGAASQFSEIPTRATTGSGFVQQFVYDNAGRLNLQLHQQGGAPFTTAYTYDSASRLIEVGATDGTGARFWYDNDDQIVYEERDVATPVGIATETVERFGPVQVRDGMSFTRVLPHVTLEGSQLRYTLAEPDGRAPWVLDSTGAVVSEQYYTVFGLSYDASVWGGVNTSQNWPLGGLHGAESDPTVGVVQFGARHLTLRGDGLWMQPEPMLAMGMAGGLTKPLGFSGVYSAGNTNLYQDPDGYFLESAWDAANVAMGVASFVNNVSEGNYGAAAVDAIGVALDTGATVIPGAPGGAGTLIKVARGADKAADAVKAFNRGADVAQGVDKAVGAAKSAENAGGAVKCLLCFEAGTEVVALDGEVPIESIQAGDVVLATADVRGGDDAWVQVNQDASEVSWCDRVARLTRTAMVPALLAACTPAEASVELPSALEWVGRYDLRTSTWEEVPFGTVQVGDELLVDGHLLRVTEEVIEDRGPTSLAQLAVAERYWTVRTALEVPAAADWVLVLNEGGAYHARLAEALEGDDRVLYGGHVFETRWRDGQAGLRWTGDVLGRAVQTSVRVADGVLDLVVVARDADAQTLSVTAEHPFWVPAAGWVPAGQLQPGDLLRTMDGSLAEVAATSWRGGDTEVFNFAVEGAHTYYVSVDGSDVVVHNCPVAEGAGTAVFKKHVGADGGRHVTVDIKDAGGNSLGEFHQVDGGRAGTSIEEVTGGLKSRKPQATHEVGVPDPEGAAAHGRAMSEPSGQRYKLGGNDCVQGACDVANGGGANTNAAAVRQGLGM